MSFDVSVTNPGSRDIKKMEPQIQDDVYDELKTLGDDPEIGGTLRGCPDEIRKYDFKELSVAGEWRAAYIILEEKKFCVVFAVGSRENFYEKVQRRARQTLEQL